MDPKLFTLAEANSLLPRLESLLRRLRASYNEREQKEELLRNTLESLEREFGDNWPLTLDHPETSMQARRSN
jgi:hypothetical protein